MGKVSNRARLAKGEAKAGPLQRLHNRDQADSRTNAPTPEQKLSGEFTRFQGSYRRTPAIDTLRDKGRITRDEHRALARYRDMAALAERSPTRSCLDVTVRGAAPELPRSAAIVSAEIDTARMERGLGSLADLARAVAVDDVTLTQWCIARHGGRERYEGGKVRAIVPPDGAVTIALVELRTAAWRLGAEPRGLKKGA